jgi:hypothetical protein
VPRPANCNNVLKECAKMDQKQKCFKGMWWKIMTT